jgi:hypothetical protein
MKWNWTICGAQPGERWPGSESTGLALVERALGRRKRLPHDWRELLPNVETPEPGGSPA